MMHYCDKCKIVRNFPDSTKSEQSVQCDFCGIQIGKLNTGTYAALVGLDRNPDIYETSKGSIKVEQILNIPDNLTTDLIHPKEKKKTLNDKVVLTFPATQKEDGSTTILITSKETGEQISVKVKNL